MSTWIRVTAVGNLTRDPETRKVGEYDLTKFTVACDHGFGKNKGTTFLDCEIWGKRAEALASNFTTGKPIAVFGSLKTDRWEKEGEKRSRVVLEVDDFKFIPKNDGAGGAAARAAVDSDEVPF